MDIDYISTINSTKGQSFEIIHDGLTLEYRPNYR